MTDRDVILVKPGITFSQPVNAIFTKLPTTQLGGTGPRVQIKRGYATVQVTFPHAMGNASFVFGNSHLEVGQDLLKVFQESQADELVRLMRPVSGPVVLLGDFNSPADRKGTRSYGLLRGLFEDPYADLKPGELGYTCCIDIYAGDPAAARSRIDLVLTRGDITPLEASVVGVERKTAAGVSASDHLGVVMTLGLVPDSAR